MRAALSILILVSVLGAPVARAQQTLPVDPDQECKKDKPAPKPPVNPDAIDDLEAILNRTERVTFTEQIAPILQTVCAKCHNPGRDAPANRFPFVKSGKADYELVKKLSWDISGQVMQELMPPPGEDPLPMEKRLLFKEWTLAGAPRGPVPKEEPKPGEQKASAEGTPCRALPGGKESPPKVDSDQGSATGSGTGAGDSSGDRPGN